MLTLIQNFYPRSPCGERRPIARHNGPLHDFYPRSPCGERQGGYNVSIDDFIFLSTLSLRRATEYWVGGYGTANNFYPRSPCGERLTKELALAAKNADFYPRSPCGERPTNRDQEASNNPISIHALLAESDHKCHTGYTVRACISIHALLAESDAADISARRGASISIHALLAESDQANPQQNQHQRKFLSTLSLRRATENTLCQVVDRSISIHALLAESDHNAYRDSAA